MQGLESVDTQLPQPTRILLETASSPLPTEVHHTKAAGEQCAASCNVIT